MLLYSNLRDYRVCKDMPRPGSPSKRRPKTGGPRSPSVDPHMHARRELRGGIYPFKKEEDKKKGEDVVLDPFERFKIPKLPLPRASDDVDPVNAGYRGLAEAEASLRGLQQKVNMLRMQLVASSEAASAGEADAAGKQEQHDPAQPRGDASISKEDEVDVLLVHCSTGSKCAKHLGHLLAPKFGRMLIYPGEGKEANLLRVEQLAANTRRSMIVIVSEGCISDTACVLAMRASHVYSTHVVLVHDITSCDFPSYEEQPDDLQDVFGLPPVPFLEAYAEYDAWLVTTRVLPHAEEGEGAADDEGAEAGAGEGGARRKATPMNTVQRRSANVSRLIASAVSTAPPVLALSRQALGFRAYFSFRRATGQGQVSRINQALREEYRTFAESAAPEPGLVSRAISASHTVIAFLSKGYVEEEECAREIALAATLGRPLIILHEVAYTLPLNFATAPGSAFAKLGKGLAGPAARLLAEAWTRRIPYNGEQHETMVDALRWVLGLSDSLALHMLQLLRSNLSSRVGKPMLLDVVLGGMKGLEDELGDELTLQEQLQLRASDAACIAALVSRSTRLVKVDLSASQLSDHGVRKLAGALKFHAVVEVLVLREGNVGAEGAQALGEALRQNKCLWMLDLARNHIRSDGARALAEALETNSTLREINLSRNEIGPDGAYGLGAALRANDSLEVLNLACNNLGAEGGAALGAALQGNTALRRLELRENALGVAGAVALSDAIRWNGTLRVLGLKNNKLDIDGALSIAEALRENRGMEKIVLCWNKIEDMGACAVFEALAANPGSTLRSLDVSVNGCRNGSVEALAQTLRANYVSLTHVNLAYNEISDPGSRLLAEALLASAWALPDFREIDLRHNWVSIEERWASRDKLKTVGFGEAPGSAMCWQRREPPPQHGGGPGAGAGVGGTGGGAGAFGLPPATPRNAGFSTPAATARGVRTPAPPSGSQSARGPPPASAAPSTGGTSLLELLNDPYDEGTQGGPAAAEARRVRVLSNLERMQASLREMQAAAAAEIEGLEAQIARGAHLGPCSAAAPPEGAAEATFPEAGEVCDVLVSFHPTFGLTCALALRRLMEQSPTFGDVRLLSGPGAAVPAGAAVELDTVSRRLAGTRKVLVCVLSWGTLQDDHQIMAMRCGEEHGKRIVIVHDIESCPMPPYLLQPEDLRDVLATKPIPFLGQYPGTDVVDQVSSLIAQDEHAQHERLARASDGDVFHAANAAAGGMSVELMAPPPLPGGAGAGVRRASEPQTPRVAAKPSRVYLVAGASGEDAVKSLQSTMGAEYRVMRRTRRTVVDHAARVAATATVVVYLSKGCLSDGGFLGDLAAAVAAGKPLVAMHDVRFELPAPGRLGAAFSEASGADTEAALREAWGERVPFHWGQVEPCVQVLRARVGLADNLAAHLERANAAAAAAPGERRARPWNAAQRARLMGPMPGLGDLLGAELVLHGQELGQGEVHSLGGLLACNHTLRRVDLRGARVGASLEGVKSVSAALLFNRTLTALELRDNALGTKGVMELAECLKFNHGSALLSLDIRGNDLGVIGMRALADALASNRSLPLESLDLSDNRVGDEGLVVLGGALRARHVRLRSVSMGKNEIGPEGGRGLWEALVANKSLTRLDLSDNALCDDGVLALARALEANVPLAYLGLSTNGISGEGAEGLALALVGNTHLTSLDLHWNEAGVRGGAAIAGMLARNRTLRELDISVNSIGGAGAAALAGALAGHPSLLRLELHWNQAGPSGARAIADALTDPGTALRVLGMSSNSIGPEGAQAIGKALAQNGALEELTLRGNELESTGVWALADALKSDGTALRALYLHANGISQDGAKGLAEALKGNSTLRVLVLDNNQCKGEGARALAEAMKENRTLECLQMRANMLRDAEEAAVGADLGGRGFRRASTCRWLRGGEGKVTFASRKGS